MIGGYLDEVGESKGKGTDIFTAIIAGALGASFSMLIGLKLRLEDMPLHSLEAMRKTSYIFSRVATGIGACLIFFYFPQSGLLQGSLFPNFRILRKIDSQSLVED